MKEICFNCKEEIKGKEDRWFSFYDEKAVTLCKKCNDGLWKDEDVIVIKREDLDRAFARTKERKQ